MKNQTFILRLEAFVLLIGSLALFHYLDGPWLLFITLFFAPDIGLLGYLFGNKIGGVTYNLTHTETFPILFALFSLITETPLLLFIGIIWIAHINFDRMLGLGLKSPNDKKLTHLTTTK